jgi:hypothetical protein
MRVPIPVRKNHCAFAFRVVIRRGEPASQHRLDAEDREKAICHQQSRDLLGLSNSRYARAVRLPHPNILKHAVLFAVSEVQRGGQIKLFDMDARRGMQQCDNLPGLRIGQRFQQHALDYAEDRGAGADAQCQGEHADGGKTGVAA